MKTYIIFLRGVMPVGKNKVPMAQLRQALSDAGLVDVVPISTAVMCWLDPI